MRTIKARIYAIEFLAEDILGFDLRPIDGEEWPMAIAGSHIDLHLPGGMVRSYSLVNAQGEQHRYVVSVSRDANSRGGSRYLHEILRVGDVLTISEPRNSFALKESAVHSVFIAGGIGITPLWSMVQRLSQIGAPWTIYYSAQSPERAAYVAQLSSLAAEAGGTLHLNFDGGQKDRMLNLQQIVDSIPADADLYCCGPIPMLHAFEAACEGRHPDTVHREYFAAPAPVQMEEGREEEIIIFLSKSDKTVKVGPTTTILDAVLNAGVEVSYSCMSGICRACETNVLDGLPDHRDLVLSDDERACGKTMMICCSRAKTKELTLEL
ncbi:2Fe-2S iron-sulfur cluster binding domain-containing protein [Glaciimonas sp. GS1]|uniref:2Fe-2S iron-sulfur cluster binding domain-containing protein n=2 Tax=Glaciimonas soli TaxID=2590999 RepID=A0A843YTX1_9BURK|nr:2Fe-2S iron-sulfur cluster binding domain-containing protein [Glaciimonas soli]